MAIKDVRPILLILGILSLCIGCSSNTPSTSPPIPITRVIPTFTPLVISSPATTPTPIPPSTPVPLTPAPVQPADAPPGPENYRLKTWSLAEGQSLFRSRYDSILQEWQGLDSLQATLLLGEELLLRFPELQQNSAFLLQLAYLQAQDSPSPAATFYEGLEIALNTNQVQPANLESIRKIN